MGSTLHVLHVFTDERGEHGNPLGVFLDGGEVPAGERQPIATELGFSETVFVDDPARGVIRIFTPAAEIPFAGHPAVGTAWLLARERDPVAVLRPPPGEVGVRYEDQLTHVDAKAAWCPPFEYREHSSAAAVDALDPDAFESDVFNWAWLDREAGVVRARGFYPGHAIREDQATGSAVLALCARLDRPIDVRQGEGSLIHSRPLRAGRAEIGGRVALAERREH